MANKVSNKKKILLWFRKNTKTNSYSSAIRSGTCFYYDDLRELMNNLLLGKAWFCLRDEEVQDFIQDFKDNKIKIAVAGKNLNGNNDYQNSNKFSNVQDGEYFVNNRIDKNSSSDNFYLMDSTNRQGLSCYGMHCKIESVKEPDENEKEIISESIKQANSNINLDSVFNLFGLLCSAKGIWTSYNEAYAHNIFDDWDNDKRERTYLGFNTLGMFDSKEVETKVEVCSEIAKQAHRLTTALTGYELYWKGYPEIDFVDGLISTRLAKNDMVEIKEICKPTLKLKDVFEMVVGDKDKGEWEICLKLLLDQCITKQKELRVGCDGDNRFPHDVLPADDLTVIQLCYHNNKVKPKDFNNLKHSFVWCNGTGDTEVFYLYIWDETATMYDMVGNLDNFINLVKNQ